MLIEHICVLTKTHNKRFRQPALRALACLIKSSFAHLRYANTNSLDRFGRAADLPVRAQRVREPHSILNFQAVVSRMPAALPTFTGATDIKLVVDNNKLFGERSYSLQSFEPTGKVMKSETSPNLLSHAAIG